MKKKTKKNTSENNEKEIIIPDSFKYNICLTFDGVLTYNYTTKILNILKKHNIKGTFFIIGKTIEKNYELVKRIIDEGHEIGNHTWDHYDLTKLTEDEIYITIKNNNKILKILFDYTPTYFRPPFGALDKRTYEIIRKLFPDLKIIHWNCDSGDAISPRLSIEESISRIEEKMKLLKNDMVLLLHINSDLFKNSEETLSMLILNKIIPASLKKNIQFIKTSELSFKNSSLYRFHKIKWYNLLEQNKTREWYLY